jgi:hypothetical protein
MNRTNRIKDMVLEDVIELYVRLTFGVFSYLRICSDYSGNHTKLSKILLNGNNICMVRWFPYCSYRILNLEQLVPGGEGPVAAASS